MINSNKIKGRIRELELSQKDIAVALNIAVPTVCQKLNGVRPFSLDEAETVANILKISNENFGEYFFSQ